LYEAFASSFFFFLAWLRAIDGAKKEAKKAAKTVAREKDIRVIFYFFLYSFQTSSRALELRGHKYRKGGAHAESSLLFRLSRVCALLALFVQTSPKRHPHVVVRLLRSRCDVSLGTIVMIDVYRHVDISWSTTEDEESTSYKVGSAKPALMPGSCGRSDVQTYAPFAQQKWGVYVENDG
jgi:hypothetical protein